MEINWMEILQPVIVSVLTVVAGILGTLACTALNKAKEWFISKTSSQTYQTAKDVAKGLYIYLEDKYKDSVTKMGEEKKAEMSALLLEKFPTLTQAELDSINKEIWLSFQEGFSKVYDSSKSEELETSAEERIDE